MHTVVVIDKTGSMKELVIKTNKEEELFKRAGFKTSTDFKLHTTFNESKYNIRLYGKTRGKATQENKYEFPSPVDKLIFFGSCLLINTSDEGEFLNLTKKEWEEVYIKLFGGFDELDSEDSEDSECDFREFIIETLTKEGYIKEGFVIDDNILDVGSGSESESESESEPEIIPLRSIPKSTKNKPLKSSKPLKSTKTPKKSKIELEDTSILSPFLECKEELEEEQYFS